MGIRTRTVLVSEALELAGDTGLSVRGLVWLNMALEKLYQCHWWPFLKGRYGLFDLASGATSFIVGDGTNTADKLFSVKKIVLGDTVNDGGRWEIYGEGDEGRDPYNDPFFSGLTTSKEIPTRATVVQSGTTAFRWELLFSKPTEKAYKIGILAHVRPADSSSGSDIPIYPVDSTIIQALKVEALFHQDDSRYGNELGRLNQMVQEDKVAIGPRPHPRLQLSSRVFRRSRS